jgi:benzoyl-CoA oxygenase/reductase BoxA protein
LAHRLSSFGFACQLSSFANAAAWRVRTRFRSSNANRSSNIGQPTPPSGRWSSGAAGEGHGTREDAALRGPSPGQLLVGQPRRPIRGVASNYICDLKVGDAVQVIGPFGQSFLMPNHPRSHIVMICTGTGSAPMRAMTEWRRRLRKSGKFESGKLMLFFGARTREELPYFGPLQSLPKDFIDINLAFSRTPGQPKRYVQDLIRERAIDLALLLADPNTHFYVCGLKSMEEGVVLALRDVAEEARLDWATLGPTLKREGRLHLETY